MSKLDREFQSYVASRSAGFVRLAWVLTGDANDAEDLVQTPLARAFQHWRRVSAAEDVDSYVRRIIVNTHYSRFRRRRVSEVPLVTDRLVATDRLTTVHDRAGLGTA